MTRAVLLRHATAVAHAATDWDRPLSEHGARQAAAVGRWLQATGIVPDTVIVSSARRTVMTYDQLNIGLAIAPLDEAYNASGTQLADLVRVCPPQAATILVVAHNPGISDLARALGHSAPLAPGCAVVAEWDGPCATCGEIPARIVAVFTPAPAECV